jgi:competence protein ComGF
MNRWGYRIVAILMLMIFAFVFHQMYKTLVMLKDQNQSSVTST